MPSHARYSLVVKLVLAVSLTASAFAGASPAQAEGVYTVLAGPKYSTSPLLNGSHQLDCSTANPYFANDACELNIDTVSAGCIWEKQSTDSTLTLPSSPLCRVTINGPIPFRRLSAYCHLGTSDVSLRVTYTVGRQPGNLLSPFSFYAAASLKPTAFNANATATSRYTMTIAGTYPVSATGQSVSFGLGTIKEVFTVDFGYPVKDACPNEATDRYSIGNVKDARSDVVQQDNAPTGFIKVDAVTQP